MAKVTTLSTLQLFKLSCLLCLVLSVKAGSLLQNVEDLGARLLGKVIYSNTCYDDIGCFYNGPPFSFTGDRYYSPPPESANETKFFLYTQDNPKEAYLLEECLESVKNSSFRPDRPTMILILGFVANPVFFKQYQNDKDEILRLYDYNVIIPEFFKYMVYPLEQAASNTRTVGARIAKFVNFLTDNAGAKAEDFHLVGWSFGGQIAGYAGKRIKNLGKITTEDTAGPFFDGVPPEVRVNQGDALFVQAIHTNGAPNILEGWGYNKPYGDVDFYVNGGSQQPGCGFMSDDPLLGIPINATARFGFVYCHHNRSRLYFHESIDNSDCKFVGTSCSSYGDYLAGKCDSSNSYTAEMGFHAQKMDGVPENTIFYLDTNSSPPFCKKSSKQS